MNRSLMDVLRCEEELFLCGEYLGYLSIGGSLQTSFRSARLETLLLYENWAVNVG